MKKLLLIFLMGAALFGRGFDLPGTYGNFPGARYDQYGSSSCESMRPLDPFGQSYGHSFTLNQNRDFKQIYYKIVEGKWLYKRLHGATRAKFFLRRKKELNYWIAKFRKIARKNRVTLDLRNEALRYSKGFYTRDLRKAFHKVWQYERELDRLIGMKERYMPYFIRKDLRQIRLQSEEAQKKIRCVLDML